LVTYNQNPTIDHCSKLTLYYHFVLYICTMYEVQENMLWVVVINYLLLSEMTYFDIYYLFLLNLLGSFTIIPEDY